MMVERVMLVMTGIVILSEERWRPQSLVLALVYYCTLCSVQEQCAAEGVPLTLAV